MKQNETLIDNKAKIQDLKRLRESTYKMAGIAFNGITVIAEDAQNSVETFALNRLSLSVNKTED